MRKNPLQPYPNKSPLTRATKKRKQVLARQGGKMKLKKGDHVVVMSGKDKGKTGVIAHAFPKTSRIIIEGVAVAKRHTKATEGQTARIIEVSRSIHASNVMLQDPKDKKPTRVKIERKEGARVRIAVKSGNVLS